MSSISMSTAVTPQAPSRAGAGVPVSESAGGMDQLFLQIMQQLQALLEQTEAQADGSALPLDGEPLPPELLDELVEFAEHLQGEVSPADKDQLTELVQQLVEDAVPQEQVRQLAQTALLLQDAQRQQPDQSQKSDASLLALVEKIRATPESRGAESGGAESRGAEPQEQMRASTDSIDALLLQAEKIRNRSAQASVSEEPPIAVAEEGAAERLAAEREAAVRQDISVAPMELDVVATQSSVIVAEQASSADREPAPAPPVPAAITPPPPLESTPGRDVAAVPDPGVIAPRTSAPSARLESAGESSRSTAVSDSQLASSVRAASAAESGTDSGDANDSESHPDSRRDRIREQGLARWVELRDSVVAQGQKLAQSESAFKDMLGAQATSARAEAASLSQSSNAASLMQLQQAYQATSATSALPGFGQPFGSQGWTPAASQRISWMAGQNISTAQLRLDPPELGSLTVRLTIQGDQTSLSFTSPHAHVREVLEQQLPRLREMLSESGLQLGQADVSDQSSSQGTKDDRQAFAGAQRGEELGINNQQDEASMHVERSLALVDYYA